LDEDGNKVLLDARVNRSWEDTARVLEEANALDDEAVITADGEREMIT
jgi:hypothetical protein